MLLTSGGIGPLLTRSFLRVLLLLHRQVGSSRWHGLQCEGWPGQVLSGEDAVFGWDRRLQHRPDLLAVDFVIQVLLVEHIPAH